MWYLLIYSWVIFALDWSSTIEAHDCRVEENPFMRGIWCEHGDLGFTLISLAFAVLMHLSIVIVWKYGYRWVATATALPVLTFKFSIALTNLVILPLWVTAWWTY